MRFHNAWRSASPFSSMVSAKHGGLDRRVLAVLYREDVGSAVNFKAGDHRRLLFCCAGKSPEAVSGTYPVMFPVCESFSCTVKDMTLRINEFIC